MHEESTIKETREKLKELSNDIRKRHKGSDNFSINKELVKEYAKKNHIVLKTYDEWRAEGMQVKRNEKALYLWSRRKKRVVEENGEIKTFFFFPLLAVFSNLQVYNISKKNQNETEQV